MRTLHFLAILFLFAAFTSCTGTNANGQAAGIKESLSVDDFEQKLNTDPNIQLVDVRTPEEYAGGHVKNALNINYNAGDFADRIGKLDKSKPVLVYCLSGGRSGAAAGKMQDMGFTAVYDMAGGMMKWRGAGKPIDMGTASPTAPPAGLSVADFEHVTAGPGYVLVDFNAKWCGPCKKMMPLLEQLATDKKGKLKLVKVDVDDNKALAEAKNIQSIPLLELYKDGKRVWTHEGFIETSQLLQETGL